MPATVEAESDESCLDCELPNFGGGFDSHHPLHNFLRHSARRRFGKPPQCYLNKVEVCSYNGLCKRRPLLSRDSKAFEQFTAECCVRATILASHNEEVGHCETHADREFARELWNLSETLTGLYFQTEDFALFCCAL